MKILSYLQARKELSGRLSEDQTRKVLTVSGRAEEWLEKIADLVQAKPTLSEVELVEESGMGREILKVIPNEEWVYLVNPSLAPEESCVVQDKYVNEGELFSTVLASWLDKQEMGSIYLLSKVHFTADEGRVVRILWNKQESIVERDELAEVLWGEEWQSKYSDWALDAMVSRLRKKLSGRWQIITIKGRGYMLATSEKPTMSLKNVLGREKLPLAIPGSIYPTDEYLNYMNDQKKVRKVYHDLFMSMERGGIVINQDNKSPFTILCVNSYSYDNVDAVLNWVKKNKWQQVKVMFTHYDPRAIELHKTRVRELSAEDVIDVWHDDMRESQLLDSSVDLVINDFRLNFNQDDKQNRSTMDHTWRVLRKGGEAVFSTVVDGRYENVRYGQDQEKAPIKARQPGTFRADEHLTRRAWSVPYYRQLFTKVRFTNLQEFDVEEGKRWEPCYRRWVMKKSRLAK